MPRSHSHVPPGWPPVVPRLAVDQPELLVHFLENVFGAVGEYSEHRPSELRIGESLIMVGGTVERMPTAAFLYVYVEDVDAAYARALELDATPIEEPAEMPYGDRRAMFKDPWGNCWQVATHRSFSGAS